MAPNSTSPIKHVVVLMFENRSFNHMFGNLGTTSPVPVVYTNTYNGNAYPQYPIQVNDPVNAGPNATFNPDHYFPHMMVQMFGTGATGYATINNVGTVLPTTVTPSYQSGYVADYAAVGSDAPGEAMAYFARGQLPVLDALAENFVVCDNWFCDVPANTIPNRLFMHAATSGGKLRAAQQEEKGNAAPTIYQQIDAILSAGGKSPENWAIYYYTGNGRSVGAPHPNNNDDENDATLFEYTFNDPRSWLQVSTNNPANPTADTFMHRAASGTLPFYNFLMPALTFEGAGSVVYPTSMHPPHDVRFGESYLAAVYNALRNGPDWESTLLVVTFDENGAIFDHVSPPSTVSPDTKICGTGNTRFDFTLLGPRVPALLISPWLEKGIIDSTRYQNTSILRYVQDLLQPGANLHLNQRDLNANSLLKTFEKHGTAVVRTDCPQHIPEIRGFPWWPPLYHEAADRRASTAAAVSASIELGKEYAEALPGHPDSGKQLIREFSDWDDFVAYRDERREAARAFYADRSRDEQG